MDTFSYLGEQLSDDSSDEDMEDTSPADEEEVEDTADDEEGETAAEGHTLVQDLLTHLGEDGEDGEEEWWEDDEGDVPSPSDPKGKKKAMEKSSAAATSSKKKGGDITKGLSRRYARKAAAARAKGAPHYKAWAQGIVEKGYQAITTLRQRTMNDTTRQKALEHAFKDLQAYVSCTCFFKRQCSYCLNNTWLVGTECLGPVWSCNHRGDHWCRSLHALIPQDNISFWT